MTDNNKIYKTTTKYTYQEFKKLTWKLMSRRIAIAEIILGVIIIGVLIFCLNSNDYEILVGTIIGFIIGNGFGAIIIICTIRYGWNRNPAIHDKNATMLFYDDRVVIENPIITKEIKYSNLYRIIPTKERIYLVSSKNQAVVVIRKNCEQALVDRLLALKDKKR